MNEWFEIVSIPSAITLCSVILGSYCGALSSYIFQHRSENKREKERRVGALKTAQFVIGMHNNNLWQLWRQHLGPVADKPDRHQRITYIADGKGDAAIDYDSLFFLLNTKEANLVLKLKEMEGFYLLSKKCLEDRNKAIEEAQARSSIVEDDQGDKCSSIPVEYDLKIKNCTESLYRTVKDALELSVSVSSLIPAAISVIDDKAAALKFDLPYNKPDQLKTESELSEQTGAETRPDPVN